MSYFPRHNTITPTQKKTQIVYLLTSRSLDLILYCIHHLKIERKTSGEGLRNTAPLDFFSTAPILLYNHKNKKKKQKKITKIADTHGRSWMRFRLQQNGYSGNSLRGISYLTFIDQILIAYSSICKYFYENFSRIVKYIQCFSIS